MRLRARSQASDVVSSGKRRLEVQVVSLELLAATFRGEGAAAKWTTAPIDLEVVELLPRSDVDVTSGTIRLLVRSRRFAPVPEGALAPPGEAFWYCTSDAPSPPDPRWRRIPKRR